MLTQYFQPEPIFKGLPLAKALTEQGHSVQVLTGFPNYPGGKLYPGYRIRLWQKEVIDGVTVIRVPLFPSHDQSGIRRAINYLSFAFFAALLGPWLIRRPDAIYVYNLITLSAVARFFRLFYRCGILLDVQDLWPESVSNSGMMRGGMVHRWLQAWSNFEYRRANRTAVLSPGFKKNLIARGVAASKVDVIYNWCDEGSSGEPDTIGQNQASVPKIRDSADQFVVTFAGTMGKMQSLSSVIEAARSFASLDAYVKFVFVGGGIEVESLKQLAIDLPNVQFVSRVEPQAIGLIYAQSNVLLVHLKDDPVFHITIPSKIQAYLYAGKPILVGVRGDAANLVAQSGAGIAFEPESVSSLIQAVTQMKSLEKESLKDMGERGRRFYDQELAFHKGSQMIGEALVQANR